MPGIYQAYSRHIPKIGVPDGPGGPGGLATMTVPSLRHGKRTPSESESGWHGMAGPGLPIQIIGESGVLRPRHTVTATPSSGEAPHWQASGEALLPVV